MSSSDPLLKDSLPTADPSPVVSAEALPSPVSAGLDLTELLSLQALFNRTRALKDLLRLKPFDTSTPQGRSRERYRRAMLTTFSSMTARAVTIITSLLTVRLTIRYLGTERYGLWMTVTSVVALLVFADFGIGNGLLSAIAEARGRDDFESLHKYVSSAFFVLLGIAALLLALFALAYPFVPWTRVFNVTSATAVREAGPAVVIFFCFFALNMPLDVVQRVKTGHQEGFESNLWSVAGNLTGFILLLEAMHLKAGLPWLLLALSGGPLLGILANWTHEFGWKRRWLLPRWTYWNPAAARKILGTGILFFLLQVCGAFTFPLDNIIITQILGPEAVAQFAVPMRLFILVMSVSSMFVVPLWPAYGEAHARGDVRWVKSTLFRSLSYNVLIFGPVALGLAAFGKLIVRIWVGGQIHPTGVLLLGMALFTIINVVSSAIGVFLYGVSKLKLLAAVGLLQAVAGLLAKIVMAKLFGLSGVIWAGAIMISLGTGVIVLYVRGLLKQMG